MQKLTYNRQVAIVRDPLFENLDDLITVKEACQVLKRKPKTVYDWKYRPHRANVPNDLFCKFNGTLRLRTDILSQWFTSQNMPAS